MNCELDGSKQLGWQVEVTVLVELGPGSESLLRQTRTLRGQRWLVPTANMR